jgi:hypothetical protein
MDFTFGSAPSATAGSASTLYKLQGAGPPTDGVTGVGVVGPGELYFDTTNKVMYLNTGTLAVPAYHGLMES